jgi:hypothetical protein
MRYQKQFARVSFFFFLIACLLIGLALPALEGTSARAAPVYQSAICDFILAQWTFDQPLLSTTAPVPSSANVTATASTSGVGGLTYQAAGSRSGNAWTGSSWSQNSTPSAYFEFDVSTVGYTDILMSFWASRSNTGPQNVSIQYSTDGSTFTEFNTYAVGTSVVQISIDLSSIADIDNNSNAKFRIYGINATGSAGNLRIDDVTFTACPVVTIDSIVPNPTNGGTTVTWHAAVNGSYELRLGGASCIDGAVVNSGSYTTSPTTISVPINGSDLVEGANTIRVCVTDAGIPHFAISSITKDTTAPTVVVSRAGTQPSSTSILPINFTVVFSEPIEVSTFVASDITQNGTATGITWNIIDSGDHMNFILRVTAVTGAGTLIPSIPAGAVTDQAENSNTASTNTDNIVTFNIVPPSSVVISEFRTRGPNGAEDEYIELYNPTSTIVDISGWKINVSNDTGSTSTRATIPASTILRSGQYYLIANSTTNGYSGIVPANLTYGQGITNAGGIALVRPDNTIVDQVGLGSNSAYKEGATLNPLTADTNRSYERKLGGASDSCQDTNDNANDFSINPSDPKNYSSQLSRCGTLLPIPVLTTTTITTDTPDPSLVNANVSVSVRVTGGPTTPSGIVNITGANINCTLTLNSSGMGSCSVRFTSTGAKTLTATYVGDQTHLGSSDTEPHQVSTTIRLPTPTRPPTPMPPPPLVAINEFVPRPGSDWNNDGVINVGDEYIELINHGVVSVNLSGYSLDDEVNIGSNPYRLPSITIQPGERIVFYGSETGLLLSDGGDGVRLLKPNGQLADAYNYSVVRHPDQSFCRLPDNGGLDDWNEDCYPTPGLPNRPGGSFVRPPSQDEESLCPIADTLPEDFVWAECTPFGNNIWNRLYWDLPGWYGEKILPDIQSKWDVYVD